MSHNTSPTPSQPGRWIVTEFGSPSVLKWEAQDIDRELSAFEVLVRVITAGIAGVDNIQRVGGYPDPRCTKPGFTPGYDFVGEVVRLGPSATSQSRLAVGTESPPCDDPIKICALPLNYMTAWGMLKRSGVELKPGNTIIGSVSGGVGTAVAQLVCAFDMDLEMIGTCSPPKFEYVKSLGVIPVDRFASDLVDQVRSLTNGEGVDVAYDAVGSEESLRRSHHATKKDVGQVISIGVMDEIQENGNGLRHTPQELFQLLFSRMQPRSSFFSVVPLDNSKSRAVFVDDFQAIVGNVRTGKLNPEIVKLYRPDQAVEAHEAIISGKDIRGKMVYIVDRELAAKQGL
ncbi:hypothetical protein B0T10DRAFT_577263 [Thelonectria olida]|uniref:Enoyl reductase (ER) domain-containing protein n=1 Tax=Thelonectria olida TaxID=1576542 RepID=A0A9P8VY19_9HYPO|nr:hypothetical protein B0T10DRAFT_577263 [Thelonectria olida]